MTYFSPADVENESTPEITKKNRRTQTRQVFRGPPSSISDTLPLIKPRENMNLLPIEISGFNKNIWKSYEYLRLSDIPFLVLSPPQHSFIKTED